MGTIAEMYDNRCTEELRWDTQVNKKVRLAWFNKWMLQFQKMILEYVSWKQSTSVTFADIKKGVDEYPLPSFDADDHIEDFYSIVQLRVAYGTDKHWLPLYRICKPMDFWDYNIRPLKNYPEEWDVKIQGGRQYGWPMIWGRISRRNPRYIFVPKYEAIDEDHPNIKVYKSYIKIFPTPTIDVDRGLTLAYNFVQQPVKYEDAFPTSWTSMEIWKLNLPWYFLDAIDDYITFRLYQAENPELATYYKQQFENTLHDNIYWLNKDKRPIDEWFADLRYFYHY